MVDGFVILFQGMATQFHILTFLVLLGVTSNFVTNCDCCYYRVCQVLHSVTDCYCKVLQVLQSVTDLITKYIRYYNV